MFLPPSLIKNIQYHQLVLHNRSVKINSIVKIIFSDIINLNCERWVILIKNIITERRPNRNFNIAINVKNPEFIDGIALVTGTVISDDNSKNGKIVWGLIDEQGNEVLYRSAYHKNDPLEKLSCDGYDIGFNFEYTDFERLNAREFICKIPQNGDVLDGSYMHLRIDGDVTVSEYLGHNVKFTSNPRIYITDPRYQGTYKFYYLDTMRRGRPSFSKIGNFFDYCPKGSEKHRKIAFAEFTTESQHGVPAYYYAFLECYIDEVGHLVSPLYSRFSNKYYDMKFDWSDYDEVLDQILKDNELVRIARDNSEKILLEKVHN
jgi:hypothetical protein